MSANNWAICPRCMRRAYQNADRELSAVMASYGKVSVEEFNRTRDSVKSVREEDYRTFREDYEIYGAEIGTVQVGYSGNCGVCDLTLNFNDEHPIGGVDG